jgi:hypothetical protein
MKLSVWSLAPDREVQSVGRDTAEAAWDTGFHRLDMCHTSLRLASR